MERLNSKWIATTASIWIQCSTGATLTFSIYSSLLKSSQGYDQSALDLVSVFKDIGDNGGILAGLLYTFVTHHHLHSLSSSPIWLVHLAGAIQCFLGYFLIWASVSGLVSQPPVILMCLYMLVASHGQAFFDTANVVSGLQNFPQYGGTIVGIMKGFQGLSSAILIQVYYTVCNGEPTSFLLILALVPALISLLFMFFVKVFDSSEIEEKQHLNGFSIAALATAAYLTAIIILENTFTFPIWAHTIAFTLLLLLLIALPLRTAIKAGTQNDSSCSLSNLLLSDHNDHTTRQDEEEMNLLQAIATLNFWLLFICMVCGRGSGLATINNIRQVGESLNYTTTELNTLVSLWSIWNFLGRFGAGYVSDYLWHSRGWTRPLLMAITQATMSLGHGIIASGFPGNLYVGTFLVGVCNGSVWSLMPTITSEIFGIKHMGTIFNAIALASPIGTYIFSVMVVGYIYDTQVSDEQSSCRGTHCFMLSFLIMAAVTLVGFAVALALFFRTCSIYKINKLQKLRSSSIY